MTNDQHPHEIHSGPQAPLVVAWDSDPYASAALRAQLEDTGCICRIVPSLDALVAALRQSVGAVTMVNLDGRERELAVLVQAIHAAAPNTAVIAMGSNVSSARVVDWIHAGASDVLLKPFSREGLLSAVTRAQSRAMLGSRSAPMRTGGSDGQLEGVVGSDPALAKALDLARAAGRVPSTVLIHGESGTGKTLLARAIHRASPRADGPFVEVACGSIPETLLESELFGHVKGAFTGAIADKKGRFLAANGGTLFFDEINSASPLMQLKLLRVLQERRFEPVGSDETIEVDVRLIAASNQSLERLVDEGRFRQDLFYRINVLPIELPPLRERPQDTLALARHFLERKCVELNRTVLGFDPDATALLGAYRWPGNVRELENAVERAVILCEEAWIRPNHLPERVRRGDADAPRQGTPLAPEPAAPAPIPIHREPQPTSARTLAESMRDPAREALLKALAACGWNRSKAAESLGINRSTLYRKMRELGLDRFGESA